MTLTYATPNTWLADLKYQQDTPARGRVTFRFDGGYDDQYGNAKPILDAHAYAATAHVHTDHIGDANYMTAAELQTLQAAGWDVGSHGQDETILTTLPHEDAVTAMRDSKLALEALDLTVRTFSPQSNGWNADLATEAAALGYESVSVGYTAAPYTMSFPISDRHWMRRSVSLRSDLYTPDDVRGWVLHAAENREWLILMFHHVRDVSDAYSVSISDFTRIARDVSLLPVDVVTQAAGIHTVFPALTWE